MEKTATIVWFRRDLRLQDNPALAAALERGAPIVPVYLFSPEEEGDWQPGGASRWWLHHALASLRDALAERGLSLVLRRGGSLAGLRELITQSGADAVFWNRRYEPAIMARDSGIKSALREDGLEATSFNGSLMWEPHEISTQNGDPYKVFTPFWKSVRARPAPAPCPLPDTAWHALDKPPAGCDLDALELLPTLDWADNFGDRWTPTLEGASAALEEFLDGPITGYTDRRDLPASKGTSRLSPYLASGQLGPRQVWAAVHAADAADSHAGYKFLSEIVWREFAYHLLVHFPQTPEQALYDKYSDFPWQPDASQLHAWQQGQTGYPIIDAGMRELWGTGWMHNRVRMIVASLLVKHLLQPWQEGARWFWDTLVDADLASNTMGWQWSAGCGADAAPYFRIFNPILQGEKFDPQGAYVKRWVPELKDLPAKYIHSPWEAPADILRKAGLRLGDNYPNPIVEHKAGRERALAALQSNKVRNESRDGAHGQ